MLHSSKAEKADIGTSPSLLQEQSVGISSLPLASLVR